MSSSDSYITSNTQNKSEFETWNSLYSTKSPLEPDYEQNKYAFITNEVQDFNTELSNSSTEHSDEINSNTLVSIEKLSIKKRFKYKVASKLKSLIFFKKSKKRLNSIHSRKHSQDLEYNLNLSSNSTSPSSSSRNHSFLNKFSKVNNFNNKTNSNKSTTIGSSIERFEKLNSKSSTKLNLKSLLLNNIRVSDNSDIKLVKRLEKGYNFKEEISTDDNFKRIFGRIPMKTKLGESENFDLLSTEEPMNNPDVSCNDSSNINLNSEISIYNINTLLKKRGSIMSKPGQFEGYLKLKFEELEESRKVLSNFLKDSENSNNSFESYQLNFSNQDQKQAENQRLDMYVQLASKLSEISFECLMSSPNELMCQLVYNKEGVRVWKKEHKSGRVLLRTEFIVPVAPIDYIAYSTDSNNRKVYDNNTVDHRVVESVSPGLDVIYYATKRVATVYPRDIVNIRLLHGFNIKDCFRIMSWDELSNPSSKINQEDVICCSCSCSTEHPDAPERPGYVRMDLSIGSYMAIPIKTPFGIWSSISMFNEASPKGWIPSSVTKMFAVKLVPGSVESIVSSMLNYYKFPFKTKINRPISGFCYRALSAIYTDQKKLELTACSTNQNAIINDNGINNGGMNLSNTYKNNKSNSKISYLLNRPLLMSIQDFIATYKSNSFQEFIEHFSGVQIIHRYIISSSSNILSSRNSDLISSSTDITRNINNEVDQSTFIDNNDTQVLQLNEQSSILSVYNPPIGKLPIVTEKMSHSSYFNQAALNTEEIPNLKYISSVERPSSFEFCEVSLIIEQEQSKASSIANDDNILTCSDKVKTNHKKPCNSTINPCKLYQDFGISYLTDASDLVFLTRLLSLD